MNYTQLLQAGVDADNFLVGPAVLLYQLAANYATTADAAGGYPRGMDDIIDVSDGTALVANGWYYLGYTENIALSRNRTVVQHDSDQEARVKVVTDVWENQLTVTALETTMAKLLIYLQAKEAATAVSGTPTTAQTQLKIGNPSDIDYQRFAVLFMDDNDILWGFVYRKGHLRPTGGPTWARTGRVEWPLEVTCYSDTRISDVEDRVLRVYKSDASVA